MNEGVAVTPTTSLHLLDLIRNTLHRSVKFKGFIARVSILPLHLQVLDLLVFLNYVRVFEEDNLGSTLLLRSIARDFAFSFTAAIA